MSKYAVFIAPTATGYSAHVPDLPGCVAAARTLEETRQLIREAIEFHIEGMRMHGDAVPEPTPHVEQIEVSAQVEYSRSSRPLKWLLVENTRFGLGEGGSAESIPSDRQVKRTVNIYLDTNLWNALCDQGVEPGRLLESLNAKGSRLVLSHQTVFELAKTFAKAPERGKQLFSYIKEFVFADALCTKEITGVLESEMRALQSPALGIRPFLPPENHREFRRGVAGLANGDFGDQANEFVKERVELGIAERMGPGSYLENRPHIRRQLRRVTPSKLGPWMERETTTAQGLMLLTQQIIRQFGGVPAHSEAVAWAFWLISSPACQLARSLVRHDLYYNWRFAFNGSIPKDLYPDMQHVLNAAYCDVYATKEPGQQNYAELLLTSRTKVAIYKGQSSLDRWLADLT